MFRSSLCTVGRQYVSAFSSPVKVQHQYYVRLIPATFGPFLGPAVALPSRNFALRLSTGDVKPVNSRQPAISKFIKALGDKAKQELLFYSGAVKKLYQDYKTARELERSVSRGTSISRSQKRYVHRQMMPADHFMPTHTHALSY